MQVVVVEIASLGNRCHLVHDGRVALVVDPPRDVAVVEAAAEAAAVEIAAVADTHVHNDYVSGAPGLAHRHGALHLLSAAEPVAFERQGVRGGDVVEVGGLAVSVIDTPGHTRHHQAFAVRPVAAEPGTAPALLSGGSLLHGAVGRTDLVDRRLAATFAGHQWSSVRRLDRVLPADTRVLPTHGFGSFCAATTAATDDDRVTLATERRRNPALLLDEDAFVEDLLSGLGPVPGHYAHMAQLNRRGAGAGPGRPGRHLDAAEVALAAATGAWVVDVRDRAGFAAGHLPGSIGVEAGDQAATYLGWLVPWGAEIVLLADDTDDGRARVSATVRDLARIGIDGVGTHLLDTGLGLTASYRRTDWQAFDDARVAAGTGRGPTVVDVRQRDEWATGHLPGALHLPVQDVVRFGATLPPGELWVHCRSGYRAGIAAGVLHRAGRHVVHVDDAWESLDRLRIPLTAAA